MNASSPTRGGAISDLPIDGSKERPDRLHRSSLASDVAKLLIDPTYSSGYVVGVEGDWGSGKTSFLNLVRKELATASTAGEVVLLDFRPWLVDDASLLAKTLLGDLAVAVGVARTEQIVSKAGRLIRLGTRLLRLLGKIPFLRLTDLATEELDDVQRALDEYAQSLDKIAEIKAFNLASAKAHVVKALEKLKRPIVVFIDDIDRLQPSEVLQMFRITKAVADFPYVRYVMAFDPSYVESSLRQQGISDPASYAEKIIQLRLPLPPSSQQDLLVLLNEGISEFQSDQPLDRELQDLLGLSYHYGLRELIETPRDLIRLFNALRIKAIRCHGEVCLADMVSIETIAIKAPNVFRSILSKPEIWTGETASIVDSMNEKERKAAHKEEREAVLGGVQASRRRAITKLLTFIFPEAGDEAGITFTHHRLRIANADRLEVFLNVGVPSHEVPAEIVTSFAESSEFRVEILTQMFDQDLHRRFFELLDDRADSIKHGAQLIEVLGSFLDNRNLRNKWEFTLDTLALTTWRMASLLIAKMLAAMSDVERSDIARRSVKGDYGFSVAILIAGELSIQNDPNRSSARMTTAILIEQPDEVKILLSEWAQRVLAELREHLDPPQLLVGMTMHLLSRIEPEETKRRFPDIINGSSSRTLNARYVDNAATELAGGGRSTLGPFVEVQRDVLEGLGGLDWWKTLASDRLRDDNLTMMQKASYLAIQNGGKYLAEDAKQLKL